MVMRAFNDVAEMAHCVDTSYWLMLKPVIHDKKEVFMRPLDDNTLPNQCSMRYQGTIAYLNAGESFQSRVACASFLVGKSYLWTRHRAWVAH